jgi:hypothetical protein
MPRIHYKNTFTASLGWLSPGQYGHLNRVPLLSLAKDSSAMTWPQGIIMGGFASVDCSLETGQTKIEWKWYVGGSGISTCKS